MITIYKLNEEIYMKDLSLIQLRDKARQDFEGLEYEGDVIEQAVIWRSTTRKEFVVSLKFDGKVSHDIDVYLDEYYQVLEKCRKPFPKTDFCINLGGNYDSFLYKICGSIASHHNIKWCSRLDDNLPVVTEKQVIEEAERILSEYK